jgi:arylsulfatase A-like enzyme
MAPAQKTEGHRIPDGLDRSVLPIKEPSYPIVTELDARKAQAPARFNVKAPANAPNVVVVLLDDIGFGHSSAFGGPIHMPNLDRLAAHGLRYNRFHTTALSSPTRTALLTGYNHHSNNAGAIMEVATAFPGNTGIRPQTITPVAQVLRMNGADNFIHKRQASGKNDSAQRAATQLRQRHAQFRLKHDRQQHDGAGPEIFEEPGGGGQTQEMPDDERGAHQHREPHHHLHGVRPLDEEQDVIEHKRDEKNVRRRSDVGHPERHHERETPSQIRSA